MTGRRLHLSSHRTKRRNNDAGPGGGGHAGAAKDQGCAAHRVGMMMWQRWHAA